MNSRQIFLAKLALLNALAGAPLPSTALPTTPTDPDTVIAQWPADSKRVVTRSQISVNEIAALADANQYLREANRPGQSRLYGLAQASLQPLMTKGTSNSDVWLAWAQIQQHQHKFTESLTALAKVFQIDPHNTTANLLAARIYLIQGNQQQARAACAHLIGHSDLLTASACLLEITSQVPDKLIDSYQQLKQLATREGLTGDERAPWIAQLLADMAMRLGDYKTAVQWLTPQLNNASVNLLAQWAQAQLAQGNAQEVITYLSPFVNGTPEQDDALLLSLALAEKSLRGNLLNPHNKSWQTQLAERVALREQRQDKQHANELARFYIELDPQPQKALYWAQVHYENSREASDRQLLEQAQALNKSEEL